MKIAVVPISAIKRHPMQSLRPQDYIPLPDERDRRLAKARTMRKTADALESLALEKYEEQCRTAEELGIEICDFESERGTHG